MVGVSVGLGPLPFYTIGMFAPELSAEFGWSFAALMGSIAVQSAVVMLVSPLAGYAVDRFGARPVAMISLTFFGLCFMSLALNNGSLAVFYSQWIVMAVLGAGTLSATWTQVVNGWFDRHKGLALGLASAGSGITGFLIKPFVAWLIIDFGWRMAFVAVGLLPIVVGLPTILLFFRERRFVSTAAPSVTKAGDVEADCEAEITGMTLKEALYQKNFWLMALAFILIAFALTAPTPNLENILKLRGFSLAEIGSITSSFGLAVIVGRLIGGWLLDRIWAPLCAFSILLVPAVGSVLLTQPELTAPIVLFAVIALGLGAGFEFDLLAYLISRYFGQRNYGLIYGCFFTVVAFGGGLGPVVYGLAFDTLGNYIFALVAGGALLVVGGALLLILGPYPDLTKYGKRAQSSDSEE
tara:strand:+ start:1003 stop:2232 length:1230 start_codon:yes stop_codon:yes gene_type:complete